MSTLANLTGNTTVFVGNAAPTTSYTAASVAEGAVAVISETGTVVTGALAANTNYKIINKKNGVMKYSPVFNSSNIVVKTKQAYSASAEQVSYIGYNGTSGSLDNGSITTGHVYALKFGFTFLQYSKSNLDKDTYWKTTSTSEADLAAGLHNNAINVFSKVRGTQVVVERVVAGTGAQTTGTWSVTNGSTVATVSVATGLAVGDTIRTGSATTAAAYKISAISGTTITLDAPYQGTTAATQTFYGVATPTAWGFKVTGQAPSTFDGLDDNWEQVRFVATLVNITANTAVTPVTVATAATQGSGNWKYVSQLEKKAHFGLGSETRSLMPQTTLSAIASSSYNYDCIYVKFYDNRQLDEVQISGDKKAYSDFYIFTATGLAYNDSNGYSLATIFGV